MAAKPTLFGPDNKPLKANFSALYPSPRQNGLGNYRPRPNNAVKDTKRNVNSWDWHEQLNYSRQLFAQLANLGGSVLQKNLWAFGGGWTPQYKGKNKKWGEEAEEWLREVWLPNCNLRGSDVFDFNTSLYLDGIAQDVDGDQTLILTEDEDTHFPLLQFIPAHCVRSGNEEEVKDGIFKGAKLYNGVFFDRNNRYLGVRIFKDEKIGSENFQDIPARNAQMLFEPEWADQGRGIPRIARVIYDGLDSQDIDDFLKRVVKQDASMGIIRTVEGGSAVGGEDHIREEEDAEDTADPQKIDIEEIRGGEFWYVNAAAGEKIEPYKSDRPGANTEAFIERIELRSIFAVGWSRFLLDPSKISGAPMRVVGDLVKKSIAQRQATGLKRARRAIPYAIAKAMKHGFISKNLDGRDPYKWGFDMPAHFTADEGHSEDADRENYKLGTTTLAAIAQKKGKNWEDLRKQKQAEAEDLMERAVAMEAKFNGKFTLDKCLEMLSQTTPNGAPVTKPEGKPVDTKQTE